MKRNCRLVVNLFAIIKYTILPMSLLTTDTVLSKQKSGNPRSTRLDKGVSHEWNSAYFSSHPVGFPRGKKG